MFDSNAASGNIGLDNKQTVSSNGGTSREARVPRDQGSDNRTLPRGVYGVGVRQGSLEKESSSEDTQDDEDVSHGCFALKYCVL